MSHVIVHGRQSWDDAVGLLGCPVEKVSIVPHGNYRDCYPPATPESRRNSRGLLTDEHRVFLFFGFMRPYKGIERLLRVWQELNPEAASLWLAGPCLDKDYEWKLRTLAAHIYNARLECGFVQEEEICRLFAGADVVVLPFEQVLTSGSVILALSYGKPVIAPRIGEVPETIGDADDFLYNPSSDEGLLWAMRRALNGSLDDVCRRSLKAGDRLNWEAIAVATAAVYADATAKAMS